MRHLHWCLSITTNLLYIFLRYSQNALNAWSLKCYDSKKNTAGGRGLKWPHHISLRGSDHGFSDCGKTPRTLTHAHKGHALRRAQRGRFFYPCTATRKFVPCGDRTTAGRQGALLSPASQSAGRRSVMIVGDHDSESLIVALSISKFAGLISWRCL